MAKKKSETVQAGVNVNLLKQIALAAASGQMFYISQDDATPLMQHNPPLIEVNTAVLQDGKAACRLTQAGNDMVAPNQTNAPAAQTATNFAIITNAELPASKRGIGLKGGGAPKKYPFDQLDLGQSFFVAATVDEPEPVKKMSSAVSSANMRYAQETGQTKIVERTKRGPGNKAVIENGVKIKETKSVPVYEFTRKFSIRPVVKGQSYGGWTATDDGALIMRTK